MGKPAVRIDLTTEERRELEGLIRRHKTGQGLVRRARIVLAAAEGLENKEIVARTGSDANTVGKWRRRFAERRLDGLYDEPRPGAPRRIGDDEIAAVIQRTLEETPPDATHWSLRSMAQAVGYAPSTIHRIWQAFGLQPHRSETFKLSTDPFFVEKVRDIVGLYMAPPERALVLCVDEEPGAGARPQPAAPAHAAGTGRAPHARLHAAWHDDAVRRPRRGDGQGDRAMLRPPPRQGIPEVPAHRRSRCPRRSRRAPRDGQLCHAQDSCDPGWLARHPRWHVHFTPTGASWLNQVERFFALLTEKQMVERKLDSSDTALRNSAVFKVVQALRHARRRKLVRMVEKRKGMCVWATGDAVTLRVVASSPSTSG